MRDWEEGWRQESKGMTIEGHYWKQRHSHIRKWRNLFRFPLLHSGRLVGDPSISQILMLFFLLLNWLHTLFSPLFSFQCRIRQASSQPRREYQPKPRMSLEFPMGDSTQPNGGLSHTGTPKPTGKELRLTDPITWTLGTSHRHFSRNSRSSPTWQHRKYTVVNLPTGWFYQVETLLKDSSFFSHWSFIFLFFPFLSSIKLLCPLSPFLSLSVINTFFNS